MASKSALSGKAAHCIRAIAVDPLRLRSSRRWLKWKVVCLISLQIGAGTDQLRDGTCRFPVLDLENQLGTIVESFGNIAAIVKNLDLVICCDTAIGHLAGAFERAGLGGGDVGPRLALAPAGRTHPLVSLDAPVSPDAPRAMAGRFQSTWRGRMRHWDHQPMPLVVVRTMPMR